jgi:hypothetical protein
MKRIVFVLISGACSSNSLPDLAPAAGSPYGIAIPTAAPAPTADAAGPPPIDAGTPAPDAAAPAIPTWTQIHTRYLTTGTIGNCPVCHGEMETPESAYSWLDQRGELVHLADPNRSVLSWYGGGMPVRGPTSAPQAVTDIDAWSAAGRANN